MGDPGHPETWDSLGRAFMTAGRLAEAAEAFRAVLRIDPENSTADAMLAPWLFRARRLEEAEKHARRAAELRPGDSWPHQLLGEVLIARFQFDEGELELREALRLGGREGNVLFSLGELYLMKGSQEQAIEAFKNALSHSPSDAALLNNVAWVLSDKGASILLAVGYAQDALRLLEQGNLPEYVAALPEGGKELAARSLQAAALDTLGWAPFKCGDLDGAVHRPLASLQAGKAIPAVLFHLGQVFEAKVSLYQALEYYICAALLDPADQDLKNRLERAYRELHGSIEGLQERLKPKQ